MFKLSEKKMYTLSLIATVFAIVMYLHCTSTNYKTGNMGIGSRFTVYGSMRCGYTVKMLDHLKARGVSYEFVDVNKPLGDAAFKKVTMGKNIRGIPYSIDHKTGEDIAGFKEIIL